MVRAAGFEPTANTDEHWLKSTPTHRRTHQDSNLVKIIGVWPSLPPPLKAAILAIINSVTSSSEPSATPDGGVA
jgi:hypothetical protein